MLCVLHCVQCVSMVRGNMKCSSEMWCTAVSVMRVGTVHCSVVRMCTAVWSGVVCCTAVW